MVVKIGYDRKTLLTRRILNSNHIWCVDIPSGMVTMVGAYKPT